MTPRAVHEGRYALALVMTGLLLAPFAWLLDLQTSYSMLKWVCEHNLRAVTLLIPVGSLTLIAIASYCSWWAWSRATRNRPRDEFTNDPAYLLAASGLALNAIFALLIILSVLPRYFLSPCA